MKYTIDLGQPDKSDRVTRIGLRHADEPGYVTPDDTTLVRIITTDYVAGGNDGFDMFEDPSIDVTTGPLDLDVIKWYLNKTSPVTQRTDGRITVINALRTGGGTSQVSRRDNSRSLSSGTPDGPPHLVPILLYSCLLVFATVVTKL